MHGNSPHLKRAAYSKTAPGPSVRSRRSKSRFRSDCCSFLKPNGFGIKIRANLSDQEEESRGRRSAKNFSKHPQGRSQITVCGKSCGGVPSDAQAEVVRGFSGCASPRARCRSDHQEAERRCAAFSASVDELVAGLRVDIDGSTATWRAGSENGRVIAIDIIFAQLAFAPNCFSG
jgi:hypothetical protein